MIIESLVIAVKIWHILACMLGFLLFITLTIKDLRCFVEERSAELDFSFYVFITGIMSGSIWSWMEYGIFWTWDPKKIATLLFLLSIVIYTKYRSRGKGAIFACSSLSYLIIILTVVIPFILSSYHVRIMF
ncbi:MAG: hypothetical protein ACTSRU_03730 [Candidatus Hodarchaeales archaeon]